MTPCTSSGGTEPWHPGAVGSARLLRPIVVSQSRVQPQTLLFCDLINGIKAGSQHLLVNWHLNGNCQRNINIWLLSYELKVKCRQRCGWFRGRFFLVLISHIWPIYIQVYNVTLMPYALLTHPSNHGSRKKKILRASLVLKFAVIKQYKSWGMHLVCIWFCYKQLWKHKQMHFLANQVLDGHIIVSVTTNSWEGEKSRDSSTNYNCDFQEAMFLAHTYVCYFNQDAKILLFIRNKATSY